MAAKEWKCKKCDTLNESGNNSCSSCGQPKSKMGSPVFYIAATGVAIFLIMVIATIWYILGYPENEYRGEVSKLFSEKAISENGDISPEGEARLAKIKSQWKISDANAKSWLKEELDKSIPPPPIPSKVSVNPSNGDWTQIPNPIEVVCNNAVKIYYTVEETLDGALPRDPSEPTEQHQVLSGGFSITAKYGEYKKIKVRFRGKNRGGLGPTSEAYLYSLDLRRKTETPINSSQNPPNDDITKVEAKGHFQQGMIYAKLKDYDNAIKEFTLAIGKYPDYAAAYSNRASAYIQKKRYDKALEDLTRAGQIKLNDPIIFYNLTALFSVQVKIGFALDSLDKCLEYGFNDSDALRKDPDLKNLRKEPEFRKILEKHKIFLK